MFKNATNAPWKRQTEWIKGADIENVKSWVRACAPITGCVTYLTAQTTTTITPVLLFYCPSTPTMSHRPGPKIAALFAQAELSGAGGSQLYLHEPETSTAGASLSPPHRFTCRPSRLSFILPEAPVGPFFSVGARTSEQSSDEGLDLLYLRRKQREGRSLSVFPSWRCVPVSMWVQELDRKSYFCLRYVADFHLFADTGETVYVQHFHLVFQTLWNVRNIENTWQSPRLVSVSGTITDEWNNHVWSRN